MSRIVRLLSLALSILLALAGCIVFAILGVHQIKATKGYEKVPAVIEEILTIPLHTDPGGTEDADHTVIVSYTYGDRDYTEELGEWSSDFKVKDSIMILVNPEKPEQITSASVLWKILPFAASVLCLVLFASAILKFLRSL